MNIHFLKEIGIALRFQIFLLCIRLLHHVVIISMTKAAAQLGQGLALKAGVMMLMTSSIAQYPPSCQRQ